ncbi:hypothetical protein QJS04_geneDACA020841 [Acorus gramineus]|uniref:Cyanobacterial aminoacyl-tRNA synthetase CAAD domain-containing protein n=1 Tax=Acorus gramineus TaxID=55184 RepID=A0AAV9BQ13_ACOGR|nr:hypothetical protein QJS04_geneDACA020841 [Acorus gramineus]
MASSSYGGASVVAAVLGSTGLSCSTRSFASPLSLPRLGPVLSPLSVAHHSLLEGRRFSPLRTRATSSEETSSVQVEEIFSDVKEKWDAIENKSTVLIYGGGAIVAVWLSSVVVGAINSVPLLPKLMELVGLGYTGWFVYRYLLFKSSRKELVTDIETLKKKITGTVD